MPQWLLNLLAWLFSPKSPAASSPMSVSVDPTPVSAALDAVAAVGTAVGDLAVNQGQAAARNNTPAMQSAALQAEKDAIHAQVLALVTASQGGDAAALAKLRLAVSGGGS